MKGKRKKEKGKTGQRSGCFSHKGSLRKQKALKNLKAIIFAFCLLPFAFSCGKPGVPIPPVRVTERTGELSAIQRGDRIVLSWPAPVLVSQESSRAYIARADIYRLVEQRDEELLLDAEEYEQSAQVIAFLDRAAIEAQIKTGGGLEFSDVIDMSQAGALANARLRYAVRYVNKRNQTAPFSNTVAIEPVTAVAQAPGALQVTAQAQGAITLSWSPPESNLDGTEPAAVVGYNVYRKAARREVAGRPLNDGPLTAPTFSDTKFRYQAQYVYVVRALSQGATGLIESADSPPLSIKPVDTFAPSAPDPVSVASANAVISLFWPTSPEADVAGYNVYRAESADAEEKDWTRLTPQPITTVTFRDDRVEIGKRYFYRVTALDRFNNESAPSRTVSETANR